MSSADALAVGALRGAPAAAHPWRLWKTGVVAAALWAAVGAVTLRWPNVEVGFVSWGYTREFGIAALVLAAVLLLAAVAGADRRRPLRALYRGGPWLVLLALAVGAWEIATAKLALLPSPFFAPPQSLIEVYVTDYKRLADSLGNSLWLLVNGFGLGAAAGFLTGVAIGWSRGLGWGTGCIRCCGSWGRCRRRRCCRWRSSSFRRAGRRRCS